MTAPCRPMSRKNRCDAQESRFLALDAAPLPTLLCDHAKLDASIYPRASHRSIR